MSLCVKVWAVSGSPWWRLSSAYHLRSVNARSSHERGHDHVSALGIDRQDITLQLDVAALEVDLRKGVAMFFSGTKQHGCRSSAWPEAEVLRIRIEGLRKP